MEPMNVSSVVRRRGSSRHSTGVIVTQAHNTKAAELHEATARSHRIAVEHLNKSQPDSAKAHASKALMQSIDAHHATVKAQATEATAAPKKL